jgi:hypothetical protein
MSEREPAERRRRLAAAGLLSGPALYMIGEFIHHQINALPLQAAMISLLGLYLWIGGILGLVHLLRPGADRLGLLGGAAAFLGLVAVTNIMLLQFVFTLVGRKVQAYPNLIDEIFHSVLAVTFLFGPLFPAALALLACGLLSQRIFPRWVTLTFLIGALAFPTGRVGGMPWLIHASDFVLTIGAMAMGWHLANRPELWYRGTERPKF